MDKQGSLVIERIFKAPAEQVWKALTEKELMKQWYFDLTEFKAEKGFRFQFSGGKDPDSPYLHLCEVIEVVPEKKLAYTWGYEGYEGNSSVTFELFPVGGTTKLKLSHEGLDTFPQAIPDFAITNFEEGWNHIIHTSLKEFLE